MGHPTRITTLFLDIGGVLLTNGWDHSARQRAAKQFGLDYEELNERHHLTFDTYEVGKLSLDEYLQRVVPKQDRAFSADQFKQFVFEQSQALPGAVDFFRSVKAEHHLKVAAVSNEGRELTMHRIRQFGLGALFDSFVCSCFVHFRKPDLDIYRIALDLTQSAPEEVVYVDDRLMFVEVASQLGIHGIHHQGLDGTREALGKLGVGVAPA